LQVAPSAYRRNAARQRNPELRSDRAKRDEALIPHIERVWDDNLKVYGADKVWKQMNREVLCGPLYRDRGAAHEPSGAAGCPPRQTVRTTVPDRSVPYPLDRVNQQFVADRPNQLWVSDFTYVSTWQGWLYVAFVVDVFARRIVGWRVSRTMTTAFLLDALEQALYAHLPDESEDHHSDRRSQYVSVRYTERLAKAGIDPPVGSKGDSYDNALAETINGLYKAELIHRRGPWKSMESLELATLEWVSWLNHQRLMGPLAYIPPNYYRQLDSQAATAA